MTEYKNKTKEELIDLLEDKDEELQKLKQSVEEGEEQNAEYLSDIEEITDSSMNSEEQESLAKKSFYAGYNDKYMIGYLPYDDIELTKAWLNYKIGAGI